MDRLETLANNDDKVKSGVNNKRVARLREYDDEIARVRDMIAQTNEAIQKIETEFSGGFIRDHLIRTCYKVLETAKPEQTRLEHERAMIARAVQR